MIAGLDIGTTKVAALIADVTDDMRLDIIGVGVAPSRGLRKGTVVDIEQATESIAHAVEQAEHVAGRRIESVLVGVTGEHLRSLNSKGMIAITSPTREISREDVERVMESSRTVVLTPDREVIHAIPRGYVVDGQNGIRQPVGMSGSRLEVETHIIHGSSAFLQNVVKCVQRAQLQVQAIVVEPIATAEAVLTEAERTLGVALADIGGGTTDVAVFTDGEIYYTGVIPVGGNHVTNDISMGLRTPPEESERIKLRYACALRQLVGEDEVVPHRPMGSVEERKVPARVLAEIVEPRMRELFELIYAEIQKSGTAGMLPGGLVLSGGGSLMRGVLELAREVTDMPVRLGKPMHVGGLADQVDSPIFATGVGLLLYGLKHTYSGSDSRRPSLWRGVAMRLRRWLSRLAQ
ncbi:MAG: cell division protein FtsA [Armatimonadota bacterium]|nr:cell division protein FtsA [bacterium]MCS7308878.1 cell division protein FtsA [Armatimonadota bacterium]MDW8103408.1 cell division protein FtsA [Armatimonadota bacterium]MDW8290472.1 cell division protein FtsA [Armatimonadota bacterium]